MVEARGTKPGGWSPTGTCARGTRAAVSYGVKVGFRVQGLPKGPKYQKSRICSILGSALVIWQSIPTTVPRTLWGLGFKVKGLGVQASGIQGVRALRSEVSGCWFIRSAE